MALTPMPFHVRLDMIATSSRADTCWNWPGYRKNGYGHVAASLDERGQRVWQAHLAAYHLLVGPVPDGRDLDHLCRNRGCINPAHLEPVTRRVNVLRGAGLAAQNAKKSHCVHGHAFTPENTGVNRKGDGRTARYCLTCNRDGRRISAAIKRGPRKVAYGPRAYCKRGHVQIAANVQVREGRLRCLLCVRLRDRRYRERHPEKKR